MADTWQDVADALAQRLNHAVPDHRPPLADCPFCEDAAAFSRYVAKRAAVGRPVGPDPLAGATSVSLADLHRQLTTREDTP